MNEGMIKNIIVWLMRTPIEGRESKAHYLTVEHLQAMLNSPQQADATDHLDLDEKKE